MFALAPTDLDWFTQLSAAPPHDLVNFWTPTPWNVRRMQAGDRLYFMLKRPIRKIGGYGSFVRYENQTASRAWEKYGLGNGTVDFSALRDRVHKYASKHVIGYSASSDPEIGCILLRDAVFWDQTEFLSTEELGIEFADQVVKLKYFDGELALPAQLELTSSSSDFVLQDSGGASEKELTARKGRDGQSIFRTRVLVAYRKRCAVTGVSCVEALDAAHIQPYMNAASNHVQNGIALRKDLHALFDAGLITIGEDGKLIVSDLVKSKVYRSLDGRTIAMPSDPSCRPSKRALARHREVIFRNSSRPGPNADYAPTPATHLNQ